jgi:hypothetical protein
MDQAAVMTGRMAWFSGAVVMVGQCGPGGGDDREDDAVPGHDGDGRAVWTR